jgi:DNA mismatch repair protein MutL
MNKIKLLSPQEAQKIAAGEVIERPANVVKELLENSIDAQATEIFLYIEKSGKKLIRVVDNGSGMSAQDARICFLPHATSKINTLDDLYSLRSFGFRGEALASISSVSKVTLITKLISETTGTLINYSEGKITKESCVSCPTGTDIQVLDLFYNIPARQKFLKQDETEWNQIQNLFYAFCLSNIEIFFKLYHENKLILNAPPVNNIKDRITQIWENSLAPNIIPLVNTKEIKDFFFSGYISNHQFWRYGRNYIFFFVNKRWVKNQELSKALLKGYLNVLPPGRFPAAFIFITIDSKSVDINCHPKKEEVRFVKPHVIENEILSSVKNTLEDNLTQKIISKVKAPESSGPVYKNNDFDLSCTFELPESFGAQKNISDFSPSVFTGDIKVFSQQQVSCPGLTKIYTIKDFNIIGQLFKTYILLDKENEIIFVDQHAAHERILYEKFLKNFDKRAGIKLILPVIISFKEIYFNVLVKEKDFFEQNGFEIEPISNCECAIKATPVDVLNINIKDLIYETLDFIIENEHVEKEDFRKRLYENLHAQMACKCAIKAGDILNVFQMQKLIEDLYKTNNRFICAHGRPTLWSITKDIIEKNFKRT